MARPLRAALVAVLVAMPVVLMFLSGGYYDRPRLWAGIAAWTIAAVAAIAVERPWPRSRAAWLALGALAALTAWTAASISWAPLRDVAQADTQRLVLYLGALLAGVLLLRDRVAVRALEPLLALGALAAIVEGLSERLLPGVFTLERSIAVPGRLSQPLTYWNAEALLAAIGVALAVRIAGDPSRSRAMRVAAGAGVPTLALGLYLTLSRGGVLALGIALVVLAALMPTPAQLRAIALGVLASAPVVVLGAALDGVRALEGSASAREREGLVMLTAIAACSALAALLTARAAGAEPSDGSAGEALPAARRIARAATVGVAVATLALFVVLLSQHQRAVGGFVPSSTLESSRLVSGESIRGDFWRVARGSFADHPLRGVGSGGYAAEWLRERPVAYFARDAHSLYFETAAELGLVGMALVAALVASIAFCGVRARARDPSLTAGAIAVVAAFWVHAGLDWDWEMPAVSLIGLTFSAALIALAGTDGSDAAAASRSRATTGTGQARREPAETAR